MKTKEKHPKAGNWHDFNSFCWFERPDDADELCIYHLNHRDSGLLHQSNSDATRKALGQFENDVLFVTFNHWAVGWIDAVAVRVMGLGNQMTVAYQKLCEIIDQLDDYPVLDEDDYSEREYEATITNIEDAFYQVGSKVAKDKLPKDWVYKAFSWFWDNDDSAVENMDNQGGYPDEEQMFSCISSLWPDAVIGES